MAAASERKSASQYARYSRALLMLVVVVGVLYLAKAVIVPLALAVLVTFILTPVVMSLQRRGVPRVPAVLLVVGVTLLIVVAVGWGVGSQVANLARDLPAHGNEMRAKIEHLRGSTSGPFGRVLQTFRDVAQPPAPEPSPTDSSKQIVVAVPEQSGPLTRLMAMAEVALEPIATAGLVLILVIFMLIRREDLRNRVIGLLGHTRLTGTTRVLVESAERVSRLLFMQLIVNAAFGLLFGIGLLIIGVPYWFLWGFLAVVLRFIPYVGSWIAAAMPVLLSFAIAPGWMQPLLVIGLFLALDLTTANVAEPLIFGHSTGVSPVALLVAALFWTWIWGPIGLVLSTPLTVCLVVLGQYAPPLRFLSLLLGDEPALPPQTQYYQRLLAGDREEAGTVARTYARENGLDDVTDQVLLPALVMARRDRKHAGLTVEDETFVFDSTRDILDLLVATKGSSEIGVQALTRVLGVPAHHAAEELSLRMLRDVLRPVGCEMEVVSTRALPGEIEGRIEREKPELLFVAIVPPGGVVQARYLCRRLRRRFRELRIVVGYFGRVKNFDKLLVALRSSGATYVTTSISQSRGQIVALLPPPAKDEAATATGETASV